MTVLIRLLLYIHLNLNLIWIKIKTTIMVKVVFIDTETTGLPVQPCYDYYHDPKQIGYYDSSRVVQIAALVYEIDVEEKTGEVKAVLLHEHDYIIKPEGFLIQNAHIHSITQSMAVFGGISFEDAMNKITPDLKDVKLLVAHNLGFDKHVLLSELYRRDMVLHANALLALSEFCTSKGCTEITKIPYNGKKYKHINITFRWNRNRNSCTLCK